MFINVYFQLCFLLRNDSFKEAIRIPFVNLSYKYYITYAKDEMHGNQVLFGCCIGNGPKKLRFSLATVICLVKPL